MHSSCFPALGTTAFVAVTDGHALGRARGILERSVRRLDETCSRFRTDSELSRANARAGSELSVSPLLAELIAVGLRAYDMSQGRVDPTLGSELRAAGYDRTFSLVRERDTWTIAAGSGRRVSARHGVLLDTAELTLLAPTGVELDLGATAKAWCADRSAQLIHRLTGSGALVALGGDVAVAGAPPPTGWPIRISDDHAAPLDGPGPVVAITHGGLATSSTTVRRWRTDQGEAHHILDPATGVPARATWRCVTVAAATCVEANVAATASIVLGEAARTWLQDRALPARLLRENGTVESIAGWPDDQVAA